MPRQDELEAALLDPNEDLTFEYKNWLDLSSNHGKATLAKAVIAMANSDGGYVVIGYEEVGGTLQSSPRPDTMREFTQDLVNGAVQRFAAPALHIRMEMIENFRTGVSHPVIVVPSTATTPVMAIRDCEGVLRQTRVYVRQPGPRSEEPRTVEEWRTLLDRCVQRSRSSMLDAIRAIVEGRVEKVEATPDFREQLIDFVTASRERHDALLNIANLPAMSPARMPLGRYEIGIAFEGVETAPSLAILRQRIDAAHRVKLTGWPKFLVMARQEMDLSRFDAAPLIAFTATKEIDYGTETDGRIPARCGADCVNQRADA